MNSTLGNSRRTIHGDPRVNITERKQRNQDWLAKKASERSEKEIGDLTGMSPRAVGNLRQRRNKISFDNFVDWCINDPTFVADFAEYVGFIKPGSAEFAAAMTRAVSEYNKLTGGGE